MKNTQKGTNDETSLVCISSKGINSWGQMPHIRVNNEYENASIFLQTLCHIYMQGNFALTL